MQNLPARDAMSSRKKNPLKHAHSFFLNMAITFHMHIYHFRFLCIPEDGAVPMKAFVTETHNVT